MLFLWVPFGAAGGLGVDSILMFTCKEENEKLAIVLHAGSWPELVVGE